MKLPLSKHVEAYRDQAEFVWSLLDEEKWLDQFTFDGAVLDAMYGAKRLPCTLRRYTPETYIVMNPGDEYLLCLQEFQREGRVKARKRKGVIQYRRASSSAG